MKTGWKLSDSFDKRFVYLTLCVSIPADAQMYAADAAERFQWS